MKIPEQPNTTEYDHLKRQARCAVIDACMMCKHKKQINTVHADCLKCHVMKLYMMVKD